MDGKDQQSSSSGRYKLKPTRLYNEDILFCIDIDSESATEMKAIGPNGRPVTRLDSIKQSIALFIHAKLSINPEHRFGFSALSKSVSLLRKEFSSEVEFAISMLQGLSCTSSSGQADLTHLFKIAAHEAKKSRAQNRIFRVILIYCRSSIRPQHQWPVNQKLFTLDVMYIHDKPGPTNCPQDVYDALVETLEHVSEYEGYIFESGQGLARILYRHMCVFLAHPQQRCAQDFLELPKGILIKKLPPQTSDSANGEDYIVPVSSQ